MAVNETTVARVAHLTRRLYRDGQRIENTGSHKHPLFEMVRKEDGWVGDGNYSWSLEHSRNQAVSGSLSTALSNIDYDRGVRFTFTAPSEMYGASKIVGRAIRATKGKGLAVEDFGSIVTRVHDNTIRTMKDRMGYQMYGSGSGSIGRRASASTNVITLTNADDVKNFGIGMTVAADTADGGGTINAGTTTVTSIDYDAGTITLASAAALTGFADNDYLFPAGDYDAAPKGLEAWNPYTTPTVSENFLGVDRSVDPIRLAGHRYDGSSGTVKEAAETLLVRMQRVGASPDICLVNPLQWNQLQRDLEQDVMRDDSGNGRFGFKYITMNAGGGDVKVYSDPDCPTNRLRLAKLDTLFIKHLDKLPHVYADDGQEAVRDQATPSDAVITWFRAWWAIGCTNPGELGVAQLSTTNL